MGKQKKTKPKSKRDRLAAYEELSKQPGFFMVNPAANRAFLMGKRHRIGSASVMNLAFAVLLFSALGAAIIVFDAAPRLGILQWGMVCGSGFVAFGIITWIPWLNGRNERLSREGWVVPGTILKSNLAIGYSSRSLYNPVNDPDETHADSYVLTLTCRFTTPEGRVLIIDSSFSYIKGASLLVGLLSPIPKAAPEPGSPIAVLYVDDSLCRVM